ncbi:fam-l protein [Plasmodium malariae]|uniref:Fam-l protein n=1 Tax=Plasmodium malariae TaxID=5858 RepID=A0A1D3JIX6_PLAMA|nr:fam-l protein [Plasmodium malariae]SBT86427.1 fam-l protein [Plasmodium malariae]
MVQIIKLLFFIIISTFIFLSWKCYFNSNLWELSKSLIEQYSLHGKTYLRIYRLLAKCKKHKDSYFLILKEEIPKNGVNERKDITNNEKGTNTKSKQSSGSSLMNKGENKQPLKNKSCIFKIKKYSHLEKKIFKQLDYVNFLKNNKGISNKAYKKIIRKKYGLRIASPLILFLLVSIPSIVNLSLDKIINNNLFSVLKSCSLFTQFKTSLEAIWDSSEWLWKALFESKVKILDGLYVILIYVIPFFILGVTLISAFVYYHKKIKKYDKIKFGER